jgi:hypothetical protein
MRYLAATDLPFTNASGRASDPQEVCAAGTELELVPRSMLTIDEADGLSRVSKPERIGPNARMLPFRWQGRVRFLLMGTQVRADTGGSIPGARRVQGR